MANKFTRKIDEMFKKYEHESHKCVYIILGYCHSGDEDGGTRDYEYFDCMWECNVDGEHTGQNRINHCLYYDGNEQEEAFDKDWDELTTMLWTSFRDVMGPNFEGTNCYYYRFYAVTKDHKLVTFVSRGDLSDPDEELLDLDTISEDVADSAEDRQLLKYITEKCANIRRLLSEVKTDKFKKEAFDEIKKLLPNNENEMKVIFAGADSDEGDIEFTLPEQLDELIENVHSYAVHNCDFYVNGKSYSGI